MSCEVEDRDKMENMVNVYLYGKKYEVPADLTIMEAFEYAGYKLSRSRIKRLNAVMQTCGFYDEAGEFSNLVGLPGKSGVGGGIIAVYPHRYSVAVWSPRLNSKGNSVMGMKALELLTTYTEESIF